MEIVHQGIVKQATREIRRKLVKYNYNLILGDSCEELKKLENESIDMVLTSPPYDNLRTYEETCVWNFDVFKAIADELVRVLKPGGVIVWVVADATINGSETGTSFKQALYFKEIGLNIHDTMIWSKGCFTAVGALKTRYAQTFEYMFVFSKGKPKTFNPIKDRKNKSAAMKLHGTFRQKDGSTRTISGVGKIISEYGIRFNVWEIFPEMSNTNRVHPAQFPETLARDHILSWSNPGDTILDPFMGGGTTGKMALLNGRNFIGIEKVEKYCEIAKNRILDSISLFRNTVLLNVILMKSLRK